MEFRCAKADNCFAGAQSYEYALPVTGEALCAALTGWELRRNEKLRRPVFNATRDGVELKGVLEYKSVKVSYPEERWVEEKEKFEDWLRSTHV